jgi:hypothetical protein
VLEVDWEADDPFFPVVSALTPGAAMRKPKVKRIEAKAYRSVGKLILCPWIPDVINTQKDVTELTGCRGQTKERTAL